MWLHRSTGDSLVASFATDSADFITDDFEDGNGVWYEVRLRVTDAGALVDSAAVTIRPEMDLSPGPIATNAAHVAAGSPADAAFWLRNLGRLPARRTHWQLLLDGAVLAEDDTLVGALDSVRVHVALPPGLAAGSHHLRAVADTLDQAIETAEANNAEDLEFVVPADATDAGSGPVRALALSAPRPNPTLGAVSLALDLPVVGDVAFAVLDLQGRVVMAQPAQRFAAGRWNLRWNGRLAGGGAAPPGVYLARVLAGGATYLRRIALVR